MSSKGRIDILPRLEPKALVSHLCSFTHLNELKENLNVKINIQNFNPLGVSLPFLCACVYISLCVYNFKNTYVCVYIYFIYLHIFEYMTNNVRNVCIEKTI